MPLTRLARLPRLGIGDLISAAHVGLSLSEPRKLPRKAHGRTEVVPVVFVQVPAGIRRLRADKLDLRQKVQIDGIVGTQPAIEASAGNAEQRDASADRRRRQTRVLVRHAVELVPHSEVERERWMHFPVVFEEHENSF